MAHTPGPWCVGTKHPTRVIAENHIVASTCEIANEDAPAHREIANARLIAASPDLRRFAQELAALEPQDFDAHMGEALIRRARALVVKADGAT